MLWELSPLVELVKGHGLQQTAWMLTVRGRFDPRGLDDAAAEASRIDARLRALLVGATSGATTRVPLHVLPEGWAVVPPDAQQHLDVEVRAIAELGARPGPQGGAGGVGRPTVTARATMPAAGDVRARRIQVDPDVPPDLAVRFGLALGEALEARPEVPPLDVHSGRNAEEILVSVNLAGRPPLPLSFPRAAALERADVVRIVGNVMESLAPIARWTQRRDPPRPSLT